MLRVLSPVVSTIVPQIRFFATAGKAVKQTAGRACYSPMQSINCVRNTARSAFDETFEVVANLNIDPKKTNQVVRGMLVLPHGNGKAPRVAAFADGKYAEDAKEAGAALVGLDDLINEVKNGSIHFDVAVTAPRYVPRLAPVARILGPKKLMPSARNGTVNSDLGQAVRDALRGNMEIKPDKMAAVHAGLGKMSFSDTQLLDNLKEFVIQLSVIKPPTVKNFIKSVYVCSTHGPSFMLDMRFLTPGRYFFNEELASKDVAIPEKTVKPSTRKRHALRAAEKGAAEKGASEKKASEKKASEKKARKPAKKDTPKKDTPKKEGATEEAPKEAAAKKDTPKKETTPKKEEKVSPKPEEKNAEKPQTEKKPTEGAAPKAGRSRARKAE